MNKEINVLVFSTVCILILRLFCYKIKRIKSCDSLQDLDKENEEIKTISEDLSSDGYESQEDDLLILDE